eukprot:g27289.t1
MSRSKAVPLAVASLAVNMMIIDYTRVDDLAYHYQKLAAPPSQDILLNPSPDYHVKRFNALYDDIGKQQKRVRRAIWFYERAPVSIFPDRALNLYRLDWMRANYVSMLRRIAKVSSKYVMQQSDLTQLYDFDDPAILANYHDEQTIQQLQAKLDTLLPPSGSNTNTGNSNLDLGGRWEGYVSFFPVTRQQYQEMVMQLVTAYFPSVVGDVFPEAVPGELQVEFLEVSSGAPIDMWIESRPTQPQSLVSVNLSQSVTLERIPQAVAHVFARHLFHTAMLQSVYTYAPELRPQFQDQEGPLRWILIAACELFVEAMYPPAERVDVLKNTYSNATHNAVVSASSRAMQALGFDKALPWEKLVGIDSVRNDLMWRLLATRSSEWAEGKVSESEWKRQMYE